MGCKQRLQSYKVMLSLPLHKSHNSHLHLLIFLWEHIHIPIISMGVTTRSPEEILMQQNMQYRMKHIIAKDLHGC